MNNLVNILMSPAAQRIAWVLLHSLWQFALLAGSYALLSHALRKRSAAIRYTMACAMLLAMVLALPITALFVEVESVQNNVPVQVAANRQAAVTGSQPTVIERAAAAPAPSAPLATTSTMANPLEQIPWYERMHGALHPALPWIVAFWLSGVLLLAIKRLGGWVALQRLRRSGTTAPDSKTLQMLKRVSERLGITRNVGLLFSIHVDVPSALGHLKPVILLPVSLLSGLSSKEIEAILAHELAHIRRHDYLVNLIQTTIETLLFYHPAVWWISRRIRCEREHCCDDLAIQSCGNRLAYAQTLAKLAENTLPAPALAASGGSLIGRIRRIAGLPTAQGASKNWISGLLALLFIGAALPFAFAVGTTDFDFKEPPMGYEKKIRMAKRDHSIKAGKLKFQLSDVKRRRDGSVDADLGIDKGYEIIAFRLFNHQTRKLIRDRAWQLNLNYQPSNRQCTAARIGETSRFTIWDKGSELPETMDIWLRIVENAPGQRITLPAKSGSSVRVGKSEIAVELLPGRMNGRSNAAGKMIWDRDTASDTTWVTTVNLENQGKALAGRYHLVAVTHSGYRHAMDHKHFLHFPSKMGHYEYARMDVPMDQIDHLELIPFKTRHKFFFNGVTIPSEPDRSGEQITIIDSRGKPIPGAHVQFDRLLRKNKQVYYESVGEALSDKDGQVWIPEQAAADPSIKHLYLPTEAEGYVSRFSDHRAVLSRATELPMNGSDYIGQWYSGMTDEKLLRSIILLKGGTVSGKILGPDGKPLPGAPLSMTTSCDYEKNWAGKGTSLENGRFMVAYHLQATSDENGFYQFDGVPAGDLVIFYPAGGLNMRDVSTLDHGWVKFIKLDEGEQRKQLDVDLSKSTAQVKGIVTDSAGNPVAGAEVSATWKSSDMGNLSIPPSFKGGYAVTSDDGSYHLSGLPPGKASIHVRHEQLKKTDNTAVILKSDTTSEANLRMNGVLPPAPRADIALTNKVPSQSPDQNKELTEELENINNEVVTRVVDSEDNSIQISLEKTVEEDWLSVAKIVFSVTGEKTIGLSVDNQEGDSTSGRTRAGTANTQTEVEISFTTELNKDSKLPYKLYYQVSTHKDDSMVTPSKSSVSRFEVPNVNTVKDIVSFSVPEIISLDKEYSIGTFVDSSISLTVSNDPINYEKKVHP